MDVRQLRCVVTVAEELHFGRAARRLDILPSALGRLVRLLEDELGVPLFERTTRTVSLTPEGQEFAAEARHILDNLESLAGRFRREGRVSHRPVRLGAIDSAAAGLVPELLAELRSTRPSTTVILTEDKSIRLLPKLLSGSLDLAIVRPGAAPNPRLTSMHLLYETPVVAIHGDHPLAGKERLTVTDIAELPMIVPERRSRPHSHDLTIKLFEEAGLVPTIAQIAEEKQTILNMVAAGIGAAIVPRWSSRLVQSGVAFRKLSDISDTQSRRLPLALVWQKNVRDGDRDRLADVLQTLVGRLAA
ncbi:LysR family transcriptional regulator [Aureimonas mangrovi]|uniref:LysR family transcriptional regulator n=1 Tax=Aureimonas mangrovi TaxID=2758041 RepID=UPI00163DD118|nr:LysR family transcriptional regulator [Aureimonas mangrovi]